MDLKKLPTPRTDAVLDDHTNPRTIDESWDAMVNIARQLERENAELKAAIQKALGELGWFVQREKDLSKLNEYNGKTWAEMLDEDLNILRDALTKREGQ